MKYRLLMLSPEFEEAAVPEVVREDVAEVCAIIQYETAEELVGKVQEGLKALAEQLAGTPQPE